MLDETTRSWLLETRARHPHAIMEAANSRRRRSFLGEQGTIVVIAADHPARGSLSVGYDRTAMLNRWDLLSRLVRALARPGVDGLLATADIVEDLLLLGSLDDKVVIGSMNRAGLVGSTFELDDRMTGYSVEGLVAGGLDAGKMVLKIADDDPGTARLMEACGRAVSELAQAGLVAMVEPLPVLRNSDGRVHVDNDPDRTARAIAVASGLGVTSAYTWLKVAVTEQTEQVFAASTLPMVILGGDVNPNGDESTATWSRALRLPTVRGIAAGRSLLYPLDGDVERAVDSAVRILSQARQTAGPSQDGPSGTQQATKERR